MTTFYIWIIIILLGLGLYSWFLWRRAAKNTRFQARLTILFLLFVLIPTIPVTISVSVLFTKTSELFLLPGVEQALLQSLDAVRYELNQIGRNFLAFNPDVESASEQIMTAANISYVGKYKWRDGQANLIFFKSIDDQITEVKHPISNQNFEILERSGAQLRDLETPHYEYLKKTGESTIVFVGFREPESLAIARDSITRAIRSHASFSYLRDTFVEQGLIWTIAIFFIIVLSLLAMHVARYLSREISEPIRALTEGMERVGTGNLSYRVDVRAKDELAFLVASFNNMAEELKSNRELLQRAERAAAWRDVARQVSHELKNPLTPIQISLYRLKSSLAEPLLENRDVTNSFAMIEEELASMRRLAEEFSEFARMPALEFTKQNIEEIVQSSVRLFEAEYPKVTVKFVTRLANPYLLVDKEQLRRAIHNLLKNAMESSSPGDKIEISLKQSQDSDEGIELSITDHGCGMTGETLKRALEPYFTTKEKGTGLGLVIVNRIIKDHGGRMKIESKPNVGTTIRISL